MMFIWKKNYYFEFKPDFILLKTGVISRQENHLPYKSIQNVTTSQSIIERVLGLGKVFIQNAATVVADPRRGTTMQSGIMIIGQSIDKAEYLNKVLNNIVSSIKGPNQTGL